MGLGERELRGELFAGGESVSPEPPQLQAHSAGSALEIAGPRLVRCKAAPPPKSAASCSARNSWLVTGAARSLGSGRMICTPDDVADASAVWTFFRFLLSSFIIFLSEIVRRRG